MRSLTFTLAKRMTIQLDEKLGLHNKILLRSCWAPLIAM